MGIESYRHREQGFEINIPSEWYMDDVEIEQVLTMIKNGELPSDKVTNLYNTVVYKIDNLYKVPEDFLTPEHKSKLMHLEDAAELLRQYIHEDNGEMDTIDLGENLN